MISHLFQEQQQLLAYLLGGLPVVFEQEPTGTGKTRVIAAYAAELLKPLQVGEIILIITTV